MGLIGRFAHWLEVTAVQMRMLWQYRTRPSDYLRTRQWFNIGRDILPADAYTQVQHFVQETVALSPRPYGKGAYGLVVAAIWPDSDQGDRWETTFTYQERRSAYEQLAARIAGWPSPPLAVMVGILPYGSLALAAA
jgi:hypothetical protein